MKKLWKCWNLKILLMLGSIGFAFFGGVFAQENCPPLLFTGVVKTLINEPYRYELLEQGNEFSGAEISFWKEGKKLTSDGLSITQSFSSPGKHSLKVKVKTEECKAEQEITIQTYEKQILYLGEASDFLHFGFEEELNKTGFLLTMIGKEQHAELPIPFASADLIIINDKEFQSLLEKYLLIKQASTAPLEKPIIIITESNTKLLKRRLAQYAQSLTNDRISIIAPSHLMNLLSDLALGKDYQDEPYSTQFSWEFKDTPKRMIVSYMVDEVLKTGFPVQILGLLLSLSVVALAISFSRQMVGLGVFGVYQPLFFALIASMIGIKIALLLLGIAIISSAIVKGLSHRFYLLQSSKISLLITVFLMVFLAAITGSQWLGFPLINKEMLFTMWFIFPLVLSILVADKSFSHFKIWTKGRRISTIELLLVSALSYGILEWSFVSNLLLSYPELLFLVLVLNLIIGRFAGLQVLELIRFMPLIKRHLDQEEE